MSLKQLWMRTSTQRISFKVDIQAVLATLVIILTLSQAAWAQTQNAELRPADRAEKFSPADSELQMSDVDLKDYMQTKYNVDVGVREEDADNQHRSKRRTIKIYGDLPPHKAVAAKKGKYGLPRAAAETFFSEEGERLFGVRNPGDIREFSVGGDQYGIVIWYERYVGNLPLEGALIQVTAREDGSLALITADLVPVTDELLEAVKQETLSEAEIREIIKEDLKQPGPHQRFIAHAPPSKGEFPTAVLPPRTERIRKEAIPAPPYVVWKAIMVWDYTIDAFAGKIMERLPTWYD